MRLDPHVKERLKKTFTEELVAQKELVTLYSTYSLSESEIKDICARFPQYATSKVENKVDPTLLGGVVIKCGSQIIDLSIRNALHLLKKQLYESN
ncbi:MAG: F0F1 ATP synthase subunit delta [Microgenomates group bacterium]